MKKTKISVLMLLAVVCALLACAFTVTAGAEEAGAAVDLGQVNVAFNEQIQLAFTVETTDALPEGAVVGIAAWAADEAEPTAENYSYVNFNVKEYGEKSYYRSIGIPATEMDVLYQYAACYKHNGVVTIGKVYQYSPIKFAGTRLTVSNTADQAKLYEKLIDYAISADKLITNNPQNYAFVKTVNGYVGNCSATIGGWLGKTVLLRAEAKNADGKYFVKWVDANGETVSASRLAKVQVTDSGITEYTAVYGAKSDSAYANAYDFEALASGDYTSRLAAFNTLAAPTQTTYGTVKRSFLAETILGNLTVSTFGTPVLKEGMTYAANGDEAFVKENGLYVISTHDYFDVLEDESGDKQLHLQHNEREAGGRLTFNNSDTAKTYYAAEVDFVIDDPEAGSAYTFTVNYTIGSNTIALRVDLAYDSSTDTLTYKLYSDTPATLPHKTASKSISYNAGETMTIALWLDPTTVEKVDLTPDDSEDDVYTYTADLKLYANGELLHTYDLLTDSYRYLRTMKNFTTGEYTNPLYYDFGKGFKATGILLSGTSNTKTSGSFDNATFFEDYDFTN